MWNDVYKNKPVLYIQWWKTVFERPMNLSNLHMHWMFKSWDCVNFVNLTAKWTITNTHLLDYLLVLHVVIVQGLINVKKKNDTFCSTGIFSHSSLPFSSFSWLLLQLHHPTVKPGLSQYLNLTAHFHFPPVSLLLLLRDVQAQSGVGPVFKRFWRCQTIQSARFGFFHSWSGAASGAVSHARRLKMSQWHDSAGCRGGDAAASGPQPSCRASRWRRWKRPADLRPRALHLFRGFVTQRCTNTRPC